MNVADDDIAALRAVLVGDLEEFERLVPTVGAGYDALFAGAFVEAVVRRFGRTRSKADIVRYVAAVRAGRVGEPPDLDPLAAERLIRAALGEVSAVEGMDRELLGITQVALLDHLVRDEHMDPSTLDAFLAAARVRAEQLTGRPTT